MICKQFCVFIERLIKSWITFFFRLYSVKRQSNVLLQFDLLKSIDDDIVADLLVARSSLHELRVLLASDLSWVGAGPTTDARNIVAEICIVLAGVLDKTFDRFACALKALTSSNVHYPTLDSVTQALTKGKFFVILLLPLVLLMWFGFVRNE